MPETPPAQATPTDRFQLFVEAVQDYGIFMLDATGVVVSWNKGAERIKGYRAEEVIGRHFSVFYPEEVRATHWPEQELKLAVASGKYEEEGWRVRKDGSRFWASVVITPLFDASGSLTGFGKVTRDLSERKALEENLRQSEERNRLLIDGVRDYAIYMLDPDGRVMSWNRGAQLIKGYAAHEVLGQHYGMFFRKQDRAEGLPAWQLQRALLHGRTQEEGWRIRKDGSSFWANIVLTPVYKDEKTLVGFAKVTRDMTERAKLHELEHSLQRMNEFLAMLGHELRNPLASMRNVTTVLLHALSRNSALANSGKILDRQLAHLTKLLDGLLDAGRLTSGKMTIRPTMVSFTSILSQAVEAIWPSIHDKGQVLEQRVEGDIWVNADEVRLVQVLQNLLANSTKFTNPHGAIKVHAAVVDGELKVKISDNGRGMEPSTIDNLFVMFAQGNDINKEVHSGLGIGLALARAVVEMHGGSITGSSDGLGMGSTFSLSLPGAQVKDTPGPSNATEPA